MFQPRGTSQSTLDMTIVMSFSAEKRKVLGCVSIPPYLKAITLARLRPHILREFPIVLPDFHFVRWTNGKLIKISEADEDVKRASRFADGPDQAIYIQPSQADEGGNVPVNHSLETTNRISSKETTTKTKGRKYSSFLRQQEFLVAVDAARSSVVSPWSHAEKMASSAKLNATDSLSPGASVRSPTEHIQRRRSSLVLLDSDRRRRLETLQSLRQDGNAESKSGSKTRTFQDSTNSFRSSYQTPTCDNESKFLKNATIAIAETDCHPSFASSAANATESRRRSTELSETNKMTKGHTRRQHIRSHSSAFTPLFLQEVRKSSDSGHSSNYPVHSTLHQLTEVTDDVKQESAEDMSNIVRKCKLADKGMHSEVESGPHHYLDVDETGVSLDELVPLTSTTRPRSKDLASLMTPETRRRSNKNTSLDLPVSFSQSLAALYEKRLQSSDSSDDQSGGELSRDSFIIDSNFCSSSEITRPRSSVKRTSSIQTRRRSETLTEPSLCISQSVSSSPRVSRVNSRRWSTQSLRNGHRRSLSSFSISSNCFADSLAVVNDGDNDDRVKDCVQAKRCDDNEFELNETEAEALLEKRVERISKIVEKSNRPSKGDNSSKHRLKARTSTDLRTVSNLQIDESGLEGLIVSPASRLRALSNNPFSSDNEFAEEIDEDGKQAKYKGDHENGNGVFACLRDVQHREDSSPDSIIANGRTHSAFQLHCIAEEDSDGIDDAADESDLDSLCGEEINADAADDERDSFHGFDPPGDAVRSKKKSKKKRGQGRTSHIANGQKSFVIHETDEFLSNVEALYAARNRSRIKVMRGQKGTRGTFSKSLNFDLSSVGGSMSETCPDNSDRALENNRSSFSNLEVSDSAVEIKLDPQSSLPAPSALSFYNRERMQSSCSSKSRRVMSWNPQTPVLIPESHAADDQKPVMKSAADEKNDKVRPKRTRRAKKKLTELDVEQLHSPQYFYRFVRHNLSNVRIFLDSYVQPLSSFHNHSGGTRSRGRLTTRLDGLLKKYNRCCHLCSHLIYNSKVLGVELRTAGAARQICFAFPGIKERVFDLGDFALVPGRRLFRLSGERVHFSEEEWSGALKGNAVAKELMQSSPDVTDLYEAGDFELAKLVSHSATISMMSDLLLAEYINLHHSDCFVASDVFITFQEVVKSCCEDNAKLLRELYPLSLEDDDDTVRQEFLKHWSENRVKSPHITPDQLAATTFLINPSCAALLHLLDDWEVSMEDVRVELLRVHLVSSNTNWLATINLIFSYRRTKLQALHFTVTHWLNEHIKRKATNTNRFHAVNQLQQEIEVEQIRLNQIIDKLAPAAEDVPNLNESKTTSLSKVSHHAPKHNIKVSPSSSASAASASASTFSLRDTPASPINGTNTAPIQTNHPLFQDGVLCKPSHETEIVHNSVSTLFQQGGVGPSNLARMRARNHVLEKSKVKCTQTQSGIVPNSASSHRFYRSVLEYHKANNPPSLPERPYHRNASTNESSSSNFKRKLKGPRPPPTPPPPPSSRQ